MPLWAGLLISFALHAALLAVPWRPAAPVLAPAPVAFWHKGHVQAQSASTKHSPAADMAAAKQKIAPEQALPVAMDPEPEPQPEPNPEPMPVPKPQPEPEPEPEPEPQPEPEPEPQPEPEPEPQPEPEPEPQPEPKPDPEPEPEPAPAESLSATEAHISEQAADQPSSSLEAPAARPSSPPTSPPADIPAGPIDTAIGASAHTSAGQVVGPAFAKRVLPQYPRMARRLGQEGRVLLRLIINAEGRPESVEVAESSHSRFEDPAVRAVKQWRFHPATRGGQPVASRVLLPIVFNLEE